MCSICHDTPHQDILAWKSIDEKNKPNPAGLKMWRFLNLIKFFEAIAKTAAPATKYQGMVGELKSAIMRPETTAALSLNGSICLSLIRIESVTKATTVARRMINA